MIAFVMSFELRWCVVTFDHFVYVRICRLDNLLAILAVELNRLLFISAINYMHFCAAHVIRSGSFDRRFHLEQRCSIVL
ncbi:hypothetical protein D3C85_1501370 [compost metagenome]